VTSSASRLLRLAGIHWHKTTTDGSCSAWKALLFHGCCSQVTFFAMVVGDLSEELTVRISQGFSVIMCTPEG